MFNGANGIEEKLPAKQSKDGFFGRYGGLIIFGLPLTAILLMTALNPPHIFSQSGFKYELILTFLIFLPMGFSVALSIRTKGLDISVPAMVMLALRVFGSTQTLLMGFIIALTVCIAIGAVNAFVIHFFKLPGLFVTFTTSMLASIALSILPTGKWQHDVGTSAIMPFLLVIIAALIAVYIAVLSSRNTGKALTQLLPVYTGSGIMSVIYVLAYLFTGERVVSVYFDIPDLTVVLLLIGIFFSITRFSKNKALALVLALVPCTLIVIADNLYSFISDNFIVYSLFILLMLILVFYRGRAELTGFSTEKSLRARAWVSMIPVVLLIAKNIIFNGSLLKSILCDSLHIVTYRTVDIILVSMNNMYFDIEFLVIAVIIALILALAKPKGKHRSKTQKSSEA